MGQIKEVVFNFQTVSFWRALLYQIRPPFNYVLYRRHLKIGSSVYTNELAARVMGPAVWLQNDVSYK